MSSKCSLTNLKLLFILISYITNSNSSCDSSKNTPLESVNQSTSSSSGSYLGRDLIKRKLQPEDQVCRTPNQHDLCRRDWGYFQDSSTVNTTNVNTTSSQVTGKAGRSLNIIRMIGKLLTTFISTKPVRVPLILPCGLNRATIKPNSTKFLNISMAADSSSTNGIGRYKVEWEQFPFIVFLENLGLDRKYCSGAIVSERYVLTAARCVTDCQGDKTIQNEASKLIGFYGSQSFCLSEVAPELAAKSSASMWRRSIKYSRIFVHPKYDRCKQSTKYDVALLEMSEPIMMRLSDGKYDCDSINRVCLSQQTSFNLPSHMALAIGWSGETIKELTAVDMSIKMGVSCSSLTTGLRNRVICADGQRMGCQLHYGAPIININRQGGMELVGIYSDHYNNCEGTNNVALASSVGLNDVWIQSVLSLR